MKQLDIKTLEVLEDAVRLLKSDFVELYKEMGYNPSEVGEAWHSLRVSPRGMKLKSSIRSTSVNQATSFISNAKEEAKARLGKKKEKESVSLERGSFDKIINIKPNLNNNTMAKGEKGTKAQSFIDQGVTDPKELSEKAGISKVYAMRLLEKAGKLVKKEKKEAAAEVETEA